MNEIAAITILLIFATILFLTVKKFREEDKNND